MARKIQIMKVTGKGLVNDDYVQAFEGLKPEAEDEVKQAFGVAHSGKLLDFVNPDQMGELAKRGGEVTEADMATFTTCWAGKPLATGTKYAIIIGDAQEESAGAAAFLKQAFTEAFGSERFVKAEGEKKFQGGAAADARKNVGQSAKPVGGVWGQKRQGPPRP